MSSAAKAVIFRGIVKLVKQPSAPLMGFGMSLFFLLVYNAGIGGIGFLGEFGGSGYFPFIFPITIVSLAMGSSAGAGQALNADMRSGYFRRLYRSPVSRLVLVVAPVLADLLSSLLFTGLLLLMGFAFGLPFRFGVWSVLGVLLLAFFWSATLCGLSVGIMLRTGRHQSASVVTNAVFPLLFLSTTFLPRELIQAGWLKTVAWGNPVTYVLEAMRYLLAGTSPGHYAGIGGCILSATAAASLFFALTGANRIKV